MMCRCLLVCVAVCLGWHVGVAPAATDSKRDTGDKTAQSGESETLDRQLEQALSAEGEDLGQPAEDPLQTIAERMESVEQRMSDRDTSLGTQRLQRQIVEDLDALINECRKCQAQQRAQQRQGQQAAAAAGPPQSQQPATESTPEMRERQAARADAAGPVDGVLKQAWGHLPPRVRDAMVQAGIDQFLPKYQQLIEDYFHSLSQEEP